MKLAIYTLQVVELVGCFTLNVRSSASTWAGAAFRCIGEREKARLSCARSPAASSPGEASYSSTWRRGMGQRKWEAFQTFLFHGHSPFAAAFIALQALERRLGMVVADVIQGGAPRDIDQRMTCRTFRRVDPAGSVRCVRTDFLARARATAFAGGWRGVRSEGVLR